MIRARLIRTFSYSAAAILLMLAVAMMTLSGCGEALDDITNPTVVSLELEPSSVSKAETSNAGKVITASMVTANFSEDVEENINKSNTYIFIESNDRKASGKKIAVSGNTITITGIQYTWLQGLEAGTHSIGAKVEVGDESITERGLAQITIEG